MSDPIAEAAAQQAQAQAVEPSLLDQAMSTIHSLEAKVEGLMHPDAAPSSTEPLPNAAGGASPEGTSSPADSAPAVSGSAEGEAGNAVEGAAPSSAASVETPSSAPAAVEPEAQAAGAEDPNAVAHAAESQPESVISSSVSDVSHVVDTLEASASEDRKRARVAIDHLRAHLWTFTGDSVAKLHAELNLIESFIK